MKKLHYACDPTQNIGIYVDLEMSGDERFHYRLRIISTYRVKLVISLPPGLEGKWAAGILQIIRKVETGGTWPLRFDYDNLTRFISLDDLAKVERGVPGVTAHVYNVPQEGKRLGFDEETLHRLFNLSRRVVRPAVAPQLEGQMSLLEDMA